MRHGIEVHWDKGQPGPLLSVSRAEPLSLDSPSIDDEDLGPRVDASTCVDPQLLYWLSRKPVKRPPPERSRHRHGVKVKFLRRDPGLKDRQPTVFSIQTSSLGICFEFQLWRMRGDPPAPPKARLQKLSEPRRNFRR